MRIQKEFSAAPAFKRCGAELKKGNVCRAKDCFMPFSPTDVIKPAQA